jgi:hypothetical protein
LRCFGPRARARRILCLAAVASLVGFTLPAGVSPGQSLPVDIRTLGGLAAPPADSRGDADLMGFGSGWLEKHPNPPPWLAMHRLRSADADGAGPGADPFGLGTPTFGESAAAWLDQGPLALTTSLDDRESTGLKAIAARGERWHLLRFDGVASARPLGARLATFGEIPYLSDVVEASPFASEDTQEPVLLGVAGEAGGFEVGAQYRSLGKRLERVVSGARVKTDQEGHEMWLARRFGLVRLRLSQSELSDNVDGNTILPRTTTSQTGLMAELAMPAWPLLSLTYAAGEAERVRLGPGAHGRAPDRRAFESVTGSASYPTPRGTLTASTTYLFGRGGVSGQDTLAALNHDLVLTMRPTDAVAIAPSVSLGHERYEWSGAQSETGAAALTVSLAPPAGRWKAWTTMGYTTARTSDGSVDSGGMSVSGGLGWDLGILRPGRSSLSVEAGYDQYQDRVSPTSSSRGVFAFALFKIVGF